MRQSHLNSEQMERMLTGTAKEALQQHVTECAECTAEVAAMQRVLGSLKETASSLAATERRLAKPQMQVLRRIPKLAWAAAVVMMAMVAMHRGVQEPKSPAVPVVSAVLSDEALLNGIQNDLEASVPAPLAPLETTSVAIEDDPTTKTGRKTE